MACEISTGMAAAETFGNLYYATKLSNPRSQRNNPQATVYIEGAIFTRLARRAAA